jgi:uncharacterized membrane protein
LVFVFGLVVVACFVVVFVAVFAFVADFAFAAGFAAGFADGFAAGLCVDDGFTGVRLATRGIGDSFRLPA